ncbi:MAG: hypothetical protein QOF89_4009 [Acidobacteriota bacterium]|jgi:hypothetical protein|nr:hypothetical protein [Acidobacteriota bacterium]
MSSRVVRAALLVFALVLCALAWNPPTALAACTNGTNQFVRDPGVCCGNGSQKWNGQSCIFGVWTDNGAVRCSGACAV